MIVSNIYANAIADKYWGEVGLKKASNFNAGLSTCNATLPLLSRETLSTK